MNYLWNGLVLSMALMTFLLIIGETDAKEKVRRRNYDARIMDRPGDVPVVKCGDEIKLTCVAEGHPAPVIEWRYFNPESNEDVKAIVKHAGRDGRIKIKTEEIFVIRSTLIIRNAEEMDQGMYQCRASNSKSRNSKGINYAQHWRIEEAPVSKVMCKDTVLTHTEVYPASSYNQSVFDDAVNRIVTSASSMTSISELEKKLKNGGENSIQPKTSSVTASSISMTSSTNTMTLNPLKLPKSNVNSVDKSMKEGAAKKLKSKLQKEAKKSRDVTLQDTEQSVIVVNRATLNEEEEKDGDNSGVGIYRRSWMMALLHVPVAIFVLATS